MSWNPEPGALLHANSALIISMQTFLIRVSCDYLEEKITHSFCPAYWIIYRNVYDVYNLGIFQIKLDTTNYHT